MAKLLLLVFLTLCVYCVKGQINATSRNYGSPVYPGSNYATPPTYGSYQSDGYSSSYQSRPVWIIANQVNSPQLIQHHVSRGANGIATQLAFDKDGKSAFLHHGAACDCAIGCEVVTPVSEQLTYIGQATLPGSTVYLPNLVLVHLDLFLSNVQSAAAKHEAGRITCDWVIKYIYQGGNPDVQVKLVLGIAHINEMPAVDGFEARAAELGLKDKFFAKRVGWAVYQSDLSPQEVEAGWRHAKVTNIWQGDGKLCEQQLVCPELERVLKYKAEPWVRKVEYWSVSSLQALKFALDNGMDVVQIGQIDGWQRLLSGYSQQYRLATHQDDPWARIPSSSQCTDSQAYSTPSYQPASYSTPSYQPVSYSTPAYQPIIYSTPAYQPVSNSTPAYKPVSYSPSTYSSGSSCSIRTCNHQTCTCNTANRLVTSHKYEPSCMDNGPNGCQCVNTDWMTADVGVHWYCCDQKWASGNGCSTDTS